MKNLFILLLFTIFSTAAYSQSETIKDSTQTDTIPRTDSIKYKVLQKVNVNKFNIDSTYNGKSDNKIRFKNKKRKLYRPTRLGSSSPLYDTYKENDFGAGAVTTNPNKSGKSSVTNPQIIVVDSVKTKPTDSLPSKKNN